VLAWGLAAALAAGCAGNPAPAAPGGTTPATARPVRDPAPAVVRLRQDLAAVFGAPVMAHAQWGVAVRSVDSGETLYRLNAGKLMVPASNMKIVTLAGAVSVLPWDHRFVTTLETAAPIVDGALQGDLIVRGGGDPTINTRNGRGTAVFAAWIAALRDAGIQQVNGRIVGDDQLFDDEGIGGGWAWDYLQYGYAAPVGSLQYNENTVDLSVLPGIAAGDPAVVRLSPGSGLTLLNNAVTAPAGVPETIDYRRHLDRPVLEVTGTVPLPPGATAAADTPIRTVLRRVAVMNPTAFFAESFRDALLASGIHVSGPSADLDDLGGEPAIPGGEPAVLDREPAILGGKPTIPAGVPAIPAGEAAVPGGAPAVLGREPAVPAGRRVLARAESPPLRDIASVLMGVSQNLYAETLLKAAGAARGGAGTTAAGRTVVQAALRAWAIDDRWLVMADGSGLSRYNYVTADLLADILIRMATDPALRDGFSASLPVAGRDGTLALRMRRSRAEGNARAKTGSISNVRTLSGYVRSRDGELLAFSILANDFIVPGATVNWIADLGVEILANFTRQAR
jgi:D-alanyl-D-alanine carboxypeptidase/D-alanyl-D-alanine-endopeptidase (penicillin-binding protein 4)